MPYVDNGGLRLFYEETGAGLPVLWHTGGCGDSRMWGRAGYPASLPGYRHVLFDHRGHGRSQAPTGPAGHHMDCYVEDVIAVLDDARISRAVMVGYSLGARIGYAVAATYPGRLAGLVALDSVPSPDEDPVEDLEAAREVLAKGTKAVILEMAEAEAEPPPEWLVEHLCTTDAKVFAGSYEAFATEPPFWQVAGRITVPTLHLLGVAAGDPDWWALGQAAAGAMPDATAVALHGLGHLQAFWRTDQSIPPIKRFLEKISIADS